MKFAGLDGRVGSLSMTTFRGGGGPLDPIGGGDCGGTGTMALGWRQGQQLAGDQGIWAHADDDLCGHWWGLRYLMASSWTYSKDSSYLFWMTFWMTCGFLSSWIFHSLIPKSPLHPFIVVCAVEIVGLLLACHLLGFADFDWLEGSEDCLFDLRNELT